MIDVLLIILAVIAGLILGSALARGREYQPLPRKRKSL